MTYTDFFSYNKKFMNAVQLAKN